LNTGHIVFASGPAVKKGEGEVRIWVVHSTKHGKKDENGNVIEGVQEHHRRFQLVQHQDGSVSFTRGMKQAPSTESDDEDDNPQDDIEEDEEDENNGKNVEETNEGSGDDLVGAMDVEVLAARMCF
jgi:cobalamin biosynthesis protein CobT